MATDGSANSLPIGIKVFGWFLIVSGVTFALAILLTGGSFSAVRSGFNAISKCISAVAGYGFLKLKRWAVYLYFGSFVFNTAFLYAIPPSAEVLEEYMRPTSLVLLFFVPVAVGTLVARHWRRFS